MIATQPSEIVLYLLYGVIGVTAFAIGISTKRHRSTRGLLMRRWAQRRGLTYETEPADPRFGCYPARFDFLGWSDSGPTHLCTGRINGAEVIAFDHPRKGDLARSGHETFSAVLIRPEFGLRPIFAQPKRLASLIRKPTISTKRSMDTESAEFNAAFDLRTTDRRWALDFLSPRSMELMMWHQEEFGIESDGHLLAVFSDRPLPPDGLERACDFGTMLLEAIPAHARLEPDPIEALAPWERNSDDPW